MVNTCCMIYYDDPKYRALGLKAYRSFKYFHPDINVYFLKDNEILKNVYADEISKFSCQKCSGIRKFYYAKWLFEHRGYEKVIVLGADTITTAYLDEFIDSTEDLVCTLNYPYQYVSKKTGTKSPDNETHVNSDVVCFNNIDALNQVIEVADVDTLLWEQGGLNEVLWNEAYDYTFNIVDHPYDESEVVYNARAKGNISATAGQKPWGPYINKWYIKDDKLYSFDDKQIKVIHYCEGFGHFSRQKINEIVEKWRNEYFTEEVREWLDRL